MSLNHNRKLSLKALNPLGYRSLPILLLQYGENGCKGEIEAVESMTWGLGIGDINELKKSFRPVRCYGWSSEDLRFYLDEEVWRVSSCQGCVGGLVLGEVKARDVGVLEQRIKEKLVEAKMDYPDIKPNDWVVKVINETLRLGGSFATGPQLFTYMKKAAIASYAAKKPVAVSLPASSPLVPVPALGAR